MARSIAADTWAWRNETRGKPERTTTVTTTPEKSPSSIFSNSAARECGFTDEFWYEVYGLYEQVLADDPCGPFDAFDIERTIRWEFNGRQVDVLVRGHPATSAAAVHGICRGR